MYTSALRRSLASRPAQSPFLATTRPISTSSTRLARRDAQDKDSLKPEPNEYSKSGSDDKAAKVEDAAFNPDKTRPEQQRASAQSESEDQNMDNPLEVSPANKEVSGWSSPRSGGHEKTSEAGRDEGSRARTSGGGSSPKAGGKKAGGGGMGQM